MYINKTPPLSDRPAHLRAPTPWALSPEPWLFPLTSSSIETIRSKSFVAIAKSRGVRAPSYVIWQVLTRSFNKCQSHIMKDLDDEETTRMTQLRVRIRKNMATKEALVETLDMIQSFVPAFVKFKAMIL
mmetsp:Transcript_2060/g.7351  ORF Transcript_2060/g.7351 Transcript_2060/m.7351 type:complete len:129 (+) Transcript_2060:922-1308(+)